MFEVKRNCHAVPEVLWAVVKMAANRKPILVEVLSIGSESECDTAALGCSEKISMPYAAAQYLLALMKGTQ